MTLSCPSDVPETIVNRNEMSVIFVGVILLIVLFGLVAAGQGLPSR